jgi:hypothetical protein
MRRPTHPKSPWGRHASQCRQVNHARNQPLQSDAAFERIGTSPLLNNRCEPERAYEQRPQHLATAVDVPREQSAPVRNPESKYDDAR